MNPRPETVSRQLELSSGGSWRFRILGPLEVDTGGHPLQLGGPKQRAVLAHLAVRANQFVSVESLVDQLWGESPPDSARNVIQTYVSHLRKALGADRIQSQGPGYCLRLDPLELDASRFEELVRAAKKALPVDPHVAVATLDDALALWRGPALSDLAGRSSLVAEAARLDESRLEAQEARIEGLLAAGDPARAISETEGLLVHHPWLERLWGLLMLAYYRQGRQADALTAFQRAREILADAVGIEPSPELTRLQARILKQDPRLDLRGEALRGYRLLEKIGDGPTGVVFRAIQPHVERDVAVKVVHEHIAADAAFVRQFEPSVQAVAALEHPCIVPIYDYWREPGRAYVVSRYMRGGSLRAFEQRGEALDRAKALRVIEQIAVAVAFAHGLGITHGNVGPSNVLFDTEGNALLGDFLAPGEPTAGPSDDTRALARLARRLLPNEPSIEAFADRVDAGLPLPGATELAEAVRSVLEPATPAVSPAVDIRNPYKGLRAFTEPDALDFFGRESLTHRLVARMRESRFLAVVGPSGAGKSSVVRAGLVPAIRNGALGDGKDLYVAEMVPGAHPMEELESALRRIAVGAAPHLQERLGSGSRGLLEACELVVPPGADLVLVIDQLEEAFTLTVDEQEREHFLESLGVAAVDHDSRCRVIVTLRADFYDRPLQHPRFGHLLADWTEALPALTADELELAIRGPAERVGVRLEPGLVAEMIADVAHQPGALPLLQYALTELFERRDGDRLTLDAYREIGAIAGALSARADRLYESAGQEGRRATRQVFLRLVTLGQGRPDTRRRILRSDLAAMDVEQEALDRAIEMFGRHRLLTFDREPATREPTVEIAHEALLVAWGRLRTWIDDAREDIRQERGLALGAAEWSGSGRDPSFLVRGARLEQFESWAASTDLAIGRPERAYLKASAEQRAREEADDLQRRAREAHVERRSARRLRGLVAVLAVATIVGGSLAVVATSQGTRAESEARDARARELAAIAVANVDLDPELSILLAIEAVQATRSADGTVLAEAEEALHRAVVASRLELSVPGVGGTLAWSPAGVFVTEGPDGSGVIDIRDDVSGETVLAFQGHSADVSDVVFSRDGSRLATTAGEPGALRVWDSSTGQLAASVQATGVAMGASFSADGSLVSAAWNEDGAQVRVLDVASDRVVRTFGAISAVDTSLSPDGSHVAVASNEPEHVVGAVFEVATGRQVFALEGPNCCFHPKIRGVSWSPDGRFIAASSEDAARIWDAETGAPLYSLAGHTGSVLAIAWSADSSRLVTGGSDGTAKVWEIGPAGARERWSLSAQETRSGIVGVAFSPDGSRVMAGDLSGSTVKVWDLGTNGDAEVSNLPAPGLPTAEFLPDGGGVVTGSWENRSEGLVAPGLTFWDLETADEVRTLGPATDDFWFESLDVSPDDSSIALGGWSSPTCCGGESAVRMWDTSTGEELWHIGHERDVNEVAFSPDGEYLASADWQGIAKIVDRSGTVTQVLGNPQDDYNFSDVAFSSDSQLIATGEWSGTTDRVRIWDWARGEVLLTVDAEGPWAQVDFDPNGPRVALSGSDGLAEIWDVVEGERVALLAGRPGGVNDLVFSPDGSRIATTGVDGFVRLFDGATGAQLLTLRGSGCAVEGVSFSGDGSMLASSSWCDGVRIWALDVDDLLEIARREARRSLTDDECRQYLRLARCSSVG